jgi:hypothetical protein
MAKHSISKAPSIKHLAKPKTTIKRQIYYIGKFKHQMGRKFSIPELECMADEMLEFMQPDASEIWLQDFFSFRHIAPRTIGSLCEQSDYFAECYAIALAIQEGRFVKQGLKSTSAMPIFCLKCRHKWSEDGVNDDNDVIGIFNNWPTEEEEAEAFAKLKDERVRDAMLEILREEQRPDYGKKTNTG